MRCFSFFFFAFAISAQAVPQWQPNKTCVLIASVTKWPKSARLSPFTNTRRDVDLVAQFKAAGVPEGNILFLKDDDATHAAMSDGLRSLASRSNPGDTLIFCFQGHGGRKVLYCYDYNPKNPDKTVFRMDEIYPLLESWKGDRLFLIGDCCCSGSFRSVLKQFEQKRPDVKVAALASATASNVSTGNWTFTEGLIRIFAGDPLADRNRDGGITITEAQTFLHDQMKYKEDQLASLTLSGGFEQDYLIRTIAADRSLKRLAGSFQIGDLLEAKDYQGNWYASEIIDGKSGDDRYKVHYSGWDEKWDEWVDSKRLRKIEKPKLNVGGHYEVLWEKQWYPALITKSVEDYFYFVHYENEAGEDDEWITPERARQPKGSTAKAGPSFAPVKERPLLIGDVVAGQWHRSWYRAKITGKSNGTFLVRYDDQTDGKFSAAELIPFDSPPDIHVGDRVLACWGKDGQMYPGKVQMLGDPVLIRWEDGSKPSGVSLNDVVRVKAE